MTDRAANSNNEITTVLLVEDSPAQALRFKVSLENGGCQVQWVSNGADGLQVAYQRAFDLIVLDVELPDINGFQICRQLKENPTVAHVPVIMLTTRDRAIDVLTGLEIGAIDYIPKDPFAEAVLLETIKQLNL